MFFDVLSIVLISVGIAYGLIALFVFAVVLYIAVMDKLEYENHGNPAGILPRVFLVVIGLVLSIVWPVAFILGREKSGKTE